MNKFLLDNDEMMKVLDHVISLFLEYQFSRGYEEPRARAEAVMDVVSRLKPYEGEPEDDSLY